MLRREPYRILFPLGALLGWVGVLPWLFFALRLRRVYEPLNAMLAYRSFLHPLAELEGFLGCFAAGLLFTLLRPQPAPWQLAAALIAPLGSAVLGALGRWELGQVLWLFWLAVVLEFSLRRAPRPVLASFIWMGAALLMGACGAALAQLAASLDEEWFWLREMGRDLVLQGVFIGLAAAAGRLLREDESRRWPLHAAGAAVFAASFFIGARIGAHLGFALRALVLLALARPLRPAFEFGPLNLRRSFAHLALWMLALGNAWIAVAPQVRRAGLHVVFLGSFAALLLSAFSGVGRRLALPAGLFALSMVGRVMVELDPVNFHLWMGLSAAAFLAATVVCARLPLSPRGAPQQPPRDGAAAAPRPG